MSPLGLAADEGNRGRRSFRTMRAPSTIGAWGRASTRRPSLSFWRRACRS